MSDTEMVTIALLAEHEDGAHEDALVGGVLLQGRRRADCPRCEAIILAARGEGGAEAEDPYTCSGCGAGLWCASMQHTLDSCEAGCRFWVEDPRNQSAWCCAGSPAGECNGGRDCTECGCMEEAEAEAEGGARREAEVLDELSAVADALGSRGFDDPLAERIYAAVAELRVLVLGETDDSRADEASEAEAPRYAIVTADQGGYYVSAPIATVTQAVALARLQGIGNFSGPAPGVVMQEAEGGAWGPAPRVSHCTECLLPFEAEGDETGGEWDECPTCRAEMEAEL